MKRAPGAGLTFASASSETNFPTCSRSIWQHLQTNRRTNDDGLYGQSRIVSRYYPLASLGIRWKRVQ